MASTAPNQVLSTGQFARPGRILIVDDDRNYRLLLSRILEQENHEIEEAAGGREALEKVTGFQPDLILLDLKLRDMDGLEVCSQLKSSATLKHVPVMVITANPDVEVQSKALDVGANDFLSKNSDKVVLLARVRSMLKYRRAVEALRSAKQHLSMRVESQAEDLKNVNIILKRRVADLEELQASARKTNEQLDQLLGAITCILIGLDTEDRITHWNRMASQHLGITPDRAIGKSLQECRIAWQEASVMKAITACRDMGLTQRVERAPYAHRNGKEGILDLSIAPIRAEGKRVTGVLIFGSDITDRVKLEEQYLQVQKMDAIGRMAGGVAHDFSNILMVIMGHCERLRFEEVKEEDRAETLEEVLACARRAERLTSQLLAFGRRQAQERVVLDLNELIGEASSMLRRMVGEHIRLSFVPGEGVGKINADANQIIQVLMNLVVNARDAMPEGGRVLIVTHHQPASPTVPSGAAEEAVIEINDTGHGIDADTLSKVFDPFFTTKELGKGTGLGLSTVYGIIEQNDGRITVDSEPGKGTTFRIYFPVTPDASSFQTQAQLRAALPAGTESILVVDDERTVRELIRDVLERSGYSVSVARSSLEAITLCEQRACEQVDLLITDLVMPDMNGVRLSERLASFFPNLKTLIMSGHSDTAVIPRVPDQQMKDIIAKPFTKEMLLPMVREILDTKT